MATTALSALAAGLAAFALFVVGRGYGAVVAALALLVFPPALAFGSFVNVVREDPVNRSLLYVGTETGVHASLDAGTTAVSPCSPGHPATTR